MNDEAELSSVQKGKVTEALVASTLILASDGRLSPFAPISDDCGIDLIVLDKQTHLSLPIQIKSRIANPARQTIQFNVRKATLNDLPNRYLLGVLFDPENIALTASWLVPMSRVSEVAVDKPDKYTLAPSMQVSSKDRYQEFRLNTASEMAAAILQAIGKRAVDM